MMGKVKAGDLVNFLAAQVGGKGGGNLTWRWPAAPMRVAWTRRWRVRRVGSVRNWVKT